jgi:hypothetical protein
MFRTHQERLPKELVLVGITDMATANRHLKEVYMPAFNAEFMQSAREEGSTFVPWIGEELADTLCERHERVVGHDNCVSFEGLKLQIPADRHRCHYVKARIARIALFKWPSGYHARPKETCHMRFVWQGNKTGQLSCRVNPPPQLRNE